MDPSSTRPGTAPPGSDQTWLTDALERTREFAVVRVALDGSIAGWHGAARLLFGHAAGDVLGQRFAILFTPEDRERGIPQLELDVAARAGRSEDDRWHIRRNGSQFWGNGLLTTLHAEDGAVCGFVKVVRDRTDLRTRYLAMQNRIDRLAQDLGEREASLMALVHELRNPLSPLSSAAELLRHAPGPRAIGEMADMIERQVAVMRGVLENARPGNARSAERPHYETVVLQDLLKPVVDGFRPEAAARNVALQLIVSSEPMRFEADPLRVHQMVANLVSNAVKYTPAGGHVAVSATIEGDLVAIRVEDDGIGIEKENLERIFELFVREGADDAVPGTGVGLAVVKRLASMHGGFVEARSAGRGQGSRFHLQLPVRARAGPTAPTR